MTVRAYVKLSDEMGEKLEHYAKKFGMSKSAFMAYSLGYHVQSLDHQEDIYTGIKNQVKGMMSEMASRKEFEDESFERYEK